VKTWAMMSVAERIELALRCMSSVLPHDYTEEALRIARKGNDVYAENRKHGFEQAGVKARIMVINEILNTPTA